MTERVCCRCGAVGHRSNTCKWPAKLTAAQQRVVDLIRAQPDGIRLVDLAEMIDRAPPSVHAMLCRIDRDAARVAVEMATLLDNLSADLANLVDDEDQA